MDEKMSKLLEEKEAEFQQYKEMMEISLSRLTSQIKEVKLNQESNSKVLFKHVSVTSAQSSMENISVD